MTLTELVNYLNNMMEPSRFNDYAPNGLQIEGRTDVTRLITGVTASQALIDAAISRNADAVLVHHGYFWRGENACLIGMKKQRIYALLHHNISLIAYHLPLDVHPIVGNNATLAAELGIHVDGQCAEQGLLSYGHLPEAETAEHWVEKVGATLARQPVLLGDKNKVVKRIAWCTGGGQGFFLEAIQMGVDLFLTGEVSEQNYHMAMETGTVFVAAGHHATERYGIQALGRCLTRDTEVEVEFIDNPNPI